MRRAALGRALALAALVAAVVVIALVLLGGGSSYTVKADFVNASQLVTGDLIQVGGTPIGKVTDINLTENGDARLTLHISDGSYAPLRRGTRFTVREASLSGIANRYVDLSMPPGDARTTGTWGDGAVIPTTETTSEVDLDQLFNVFGPRERKGLSQLIRGSASQYQGKGELARAGFAHLNPAVASSSALFRELNRDTPKLRRFITASASLVHDIAQKRNDLSSLVDNLDTTTGAIRRPPGALGLAIRRLPGFMAPGQHHVREPARDQALTLFSTQDANGGYRPLFLTAPCSTYKQIVAEQARGVKFLLNLDPILDNAFACQGSATSNLPLPGQPTLPPIHLRQHKANK